MGLDMYLNRVPKTETNEQLAELVGSNDEFTTRKEVIAHGKKCSKHFDPKRHIHHSKFFPEGWIGKQIGYWRKANQIHRWFVDNVQGGVDDCGDYLVTKEQLEELLELAKSITKDNAEELLPTQPGFFFGSYDYDDWYFQDIKDTIRTVKEALKKVDFKKDSVYYRASW